MDTLQLDSPQAVEAAFYAAFEGGDLGAMTALWDDGEDVVCVHPMGPVLRGASEVLESWRQLLGAGERMHFEPRVLGRFESAALAVHHVHEHIAFGADLRSRSLVIATNVYRHTAAGWRMVAHHGSPGRESGPVPQHDTAPGVVH